MLTTEQIQRFRAETPGVKNRMHFNNAGAALMPQLVIDAIQKHLQLEIEIGGYEAEALVQKEIEGFYQAMALFLNCKSDNIAYAGNATDAYNRALSAIPFAEDDVIITTNNDYVSNQIAFLELQKRYGIQLIRAQDRPEGAVDVDSMRALIKKHSPKLVAVTHVPTNSGLVQPIIEIGNICAEEDIFYLVDACQSAGQMPLDVQQIKCDFLSATYRKFLRGPRGAGFLYASDKALDLELEPIFVDLHSATWIEPDIYELRQDARRFEVWERPFALMLGSKACVEYALEIGLPNIEQRVKMLADLCRNKISAIPGIRNLDKGIERCGITTYALKNWQPDALKNKLQEHKINTTITRSGGAIIDFAEKGVDWALRVSPHYYNTEEEIDILTNVLSDLIRS
ncbi:MAG: aminotransferase class V-fold PLP-dependent enzyme [Saprospiraceae bacterium]|nr:aminotransferase class V-fold PLP-dependent enzyme [Saprospiraceae bacterium]